MAYSKVGIFNMALNHLSITAPISTNSMDKDARAIVLNNFYETARLLTGVLQIHIEI